MDFSTISLFLVGLHDLYPSPNIHIIKSTKMGWVGHVARCGRGEALAGLWEGEPVGKRPLGILRRRWYDNIEMCIQEVT